MTCVVLVGDEEFLQHREVTRIADNMRKDGEVVERDEYEASALSAAQLPELLGPSLFSPTRLVVIRDVHTAPKAFVDVLTQHAAQIPENTTLVLTHTGGARTKTAIQTLRAQGASIRECRKVNRRSERVDFVRQELTSAGKKVSRDAAELLVDAVGSDLRQLSIACSQLSQDTEGGIDVEAVRRYHAGRAEVTGFAVADAAMAGDLPGALSALRHATYAGTDPVLVADALADGVRSVAKVAGARGGNLASELRMPPWKVEKMQRFARQWSPLALVEAMQIVADANARVRGGQDDRVWALERALVAMADVRAAG